MQSNSAYWPDLSAHQSYWEHHNNPYVYQYDPADDGPEVETIVSIRINHSEGMLSRENRQRTQRVLIELIHEFRFLQVLEAKTKQ